MRRPDKPTAETVLETLQTFYRTHGVLPSYEGIRAALGLRTRSMVQRRVEVLMEQGFLSSVAKGAKRMAPGPRFFERAIGRPIPAGIPDVGELGLDERIAIDSFLVPDPARTALHRINGDSMIERGLFDGDMAVVEMGKRASAGDIVLARLDGAETIKVLAHDSKGNYLLPANPAYRELRPVTELTVLGVVVGTFGRR
ncbi:MAG: LexA family protein [Rhodanobacter sp.]